MVSKFKSKNTQKISKDKVKDKVGITLYLENYYINLSHKGIR